MNILMKALAASAMLCAAMPAAAAEYVFTTTGSSSVNGAYGNALTFASGPANVRVTGWQANQSTNAISSAYLAAFGGGLGVTGLGDSNGTNNYHQIDNAGGYTDFVFLQFDWAVNLTSANLNSYGLPGVGTDNDIQFTSTTVPSALWNSAVDLSGYSFGGPYTGNDGSTASRTATLGSSGFFNQWVIAAASGSGYNDGFKLASLKVNTAAVPEPATWAMMLIGFGAVGASMRRRRPVLARQAA